MNFDDSFTKLLGEEGGFVDNPADKGGATMWGVTEKVARASGYVGAMKDMPQQVAKVIYQKQYWNPAGCDAVPEAIKFDMFDVAVNSGTRQAIVFLQKSVNETQDGVLGAHTIMAAQSMDPFRLVAHFNGYRLDFMNDLSNWQTFGRGWTQRVADILKAV